MQKGSIGLLVILIGILVGVVVTAGAFYYSNHKFDKQIIVTDFESCAAAGNPIMESYPAQCNAKDGRHFVQKLSEEEKKKLIPPSVDLPVATQSSELYEIDDGTAKEYINHLFGYSLIFDKSIPFEEKEQGKLLIFDDQITLQVLDQNPEYCRGDCSTSFYKTEYITIPGHPTPVKKLYSQVTGAIGGVTPQRYQSLVFTENNKQFFVLEANELKLSNQDFRSPDQIKDVPTAVLEKLNAIASSFRITEE